MPTYTFTSRKKRNKACSLPSYKKQFEIISDVAQERKRVMKRIIILFISIVFVYDIFAQNMINIEGRVYDFKTRTDLVGASVQIMDADSNIIASTIASSFTQ